MSFGIPVRNGLGIGLLASTSLATGNVGLPSPALSLEFAGATTLDPRITFSRPSLATLYDSTGLLTYAPNNLSLNSQDFSGAVWNASNFSRTTGQSDPFGGTSATLGTFTSNGGDGLFQSGLGLIADKFYIISFYARFGTWRWFEFTTVSGGATRSFVDMENGVAGNTAHSNFLVASVGNGWYRISAKVTGAGEFYWTPRPANGNSGAATTNNGATFYVYGFQAEAVTYQTTPSTYIATTSSAYYGPRFDYNPATLAARGLLIEEARVNLLTRTQEFENAVWLKGGVTVTSNQGIAPDGTNTADLAVVNNGAQANVALYQDMIALSASTSYTVSASVKKSGARYAVVGWLYSGGVFGAVSYDLDTQTVSRSAVAGGFAIVSSSIVSEGNGWYRITVTATTPTTAAFSRFPSVFPRVTAWTSGPPDGADTGNGTDGILIWGAQLEAGTFATSYIPTGASAVARSADSASMTGANFSSWYNQSQGTFVANSSTFRTGTAYGGILEATNASGADRVSVGVIGPNGYQLILTGGSTQAVWDEGAANNPNAYVSGSAVKIALAFIVNSANRSLAGVLGAEDTTLLTPTPDRLLIGDDFAGRRLNGHIASLNYYSTRLPNTTLQSLST